MEEAQIKLCSFLSREPDCVDEFLDWFITYKDPRITFQEEPTFLLVQASCTLLVFLNFIHAWKHGGRFIHFWWATLIVSLATECLCYAMPNINNFWHAQGVIGLFGKRFPFYIVIVYNMLWYPAFVAISRANLSWWAEPFAAGLLSVFMDLPYDIMGIKMLWWTWHDEDGNIFDRHYDVPWTSYYFHSAFLAGCWIVFFGTRRLLMPSTGKWGYGNFFIEWFCTILAGISAMPVGSIFFVMLYHPLHDIFGIHTEVPVIIWLGIIAAITWFSDRQPTEAARANVKLYTKRPWLDTVLLGIYIHFVFFALLVHYAVPENVRSTGLHQRTGPCNETEDTFSAIGMVIPRKKYLCTSDYNEPMDWHCLPDGKPPANGLDWYTICGLPFTNQWEYRFYVWFSCAAGLLVYVQFLVFSGKQPPPVKRSAPVNSTPTMTKQHKKKKKQH